MCIVRRIRNMDGRYSSRSRLSTAEKFLRKFLRREKVVVVVVGGGVWETIGFARHTHTHTLWGRTRRDAPVGQFKGRLKYSIPHVLSYGVYHNRT